MNTEDMNKEDAKYVISDFLTKKDEELKYLDRSEITLYVSLLNQNISSLKNDIPVFRDFVYHFLRLLCLNGETVDIMKNDQVETVLIELIIRYMNEDLQKVQDCKRIDCLTLLAHSIEKLQYFDVTILQAEEESERRRNTRAELENRVVPLFSVAIKSENISQKDLSAILETLLVVILQIAIKGGIFKSSNISLDIQALQGCLQIDNDKIRNLSTYLLLYSGENITVKKEVITTTLQWTNEAIHSTTLKSENGLDINVLLYGLQLISFKDIDLFETDTKPELMKDFLFNCSLLWNTNTKKNINIMASSLIVIYNQLNKSKRCKELTNFPHEIIHQIMKINDKTMKTTAHLTFIIINKLTDTKVQELSDDVLSHILEWLNEAYFSKSKLYRDRFRCTDLMSAIDFIATFPQIKLKLESRLLHLVKDPLLEELCQRYKISKEKINSIENEGSSKEITSKTKYSKKDIDLLLLGKTGEGKSSTGNTILDKKVFTSSNSTTSETHQLETGKRTFNGREIKIVDTPGLEDTDGIDDDELTTERTVAIMQEAILSHSYGYHSFLIVLRFGSRFRKEDKLVIEMLKDIFGDDVVKQYSVLLLTHGDNFRSKKENKNKKFKTWCNEQKGVFKELFDECNHRAVLFDNETEDPFTKNRQMIKLLAKIDSLPSNGIRYTDEHFKAAEERRQILILKHKMERITKETRQEVNTILEKMKTIEKLNPREQKEILKDLFNKGLILKENVKKADCNTNFFKAAEKSTTNLMVTIRTLYIKAFKMMEKKDIELVKFKVTNEYSKKEVRYREEQKNETPQKHKKTQTEKEMEEMKQSIKNYEKKLRNITDEVAKLQKASENSLRETDMNYLQTISILINENEELSCELEKKTSTFFKRLKNLFKFSKNKRTNRPTCDK